MVTAIYASLLGFIHVFLSILVIRSRRTNKNGYSAGDNSAIKCQVSAANNFCSHIPLLLVLFYLLESHFSPPIVVLHIFGVLICLGRIFHATSLLRFEKKQ